jgi:hypothetical protein
MPAFLHDFAHYHDKGDNQDQADGLESTHTDQGNLNPSKGSEIHPEPQDQGADEERKTQLETQPVEQQNEAKYGKDLYDRWNGRNLLSL